MEICRHAVKYGLCRGDLMLNRAYVQAKAFILAIQFLSRFPVPRLRDVEPADVDRSYAYFPVVGVMLGGAYALLAVVAHIFFSSSLLVATLVVGSQLYLTGGLHIDGLMDTADGLLSYRSKEDVLAIMKDSRVGAMGVMAFGVDLLLRIAVYQSLPLLLFVSLLFVTPFFSRSVLLLLLRFTRPARTDGLGARAMQKTRGSIIFTTNGIAVLVVAGLLGKTGLLGVLLGALVLLRFIRTCDRRIGGMTGDTFGAAIELLEVLLALATASRPF